MQLKGLVSVHVLTEMTFIYKKAVLASCFAYMNALKMFLLLKSLNAV